MNLIPKSPYPMGTRIIPICIRSNEAQEGKVTSHGHRMGQQGHAKPARLTPGSRSQQGITWVASSSQRQEKTQEVVNR